MRNRERLIRVRLMGWSKVGRIVSGLGGGDEDLFQARGREKDDYGRGAWSGSVDWWMGGVVAVAEEALFSQWSW